jgi:hypothetical protein
MVDARRRAVGDLPDHQAASHFASPSPINSLSSASLQAPLLTRRDRTGAYLMACELPPGSL